MKKEQTLQLTKDELQKQLKRKSASLERMKKKTKISEEAHSREAQIEAALERVRSRSLDMHKSDELREVVKVVFEQLQELDFAIDGAAFIGTVIENSKDINIWIGDKHAKYPSCFRTPVYDAPSVTDILKAKESGADFFSKTYSFEEKNKWFKYAFENTDLKTLPDQLKNWILEQQYLTQSFAWAKNSGVGIHFHHQRTLSENEIDILKRFSKVFEQGYTRFLDLQKAEAQARKAEIELALERVRSRAMAMHKTDELLDVAELLYHEMIGLGITSVVVTYSIMMDDGKSALYYGINPVDGKRSKPIVLLHTGSEVMKSILHSWKKQEPINSIELDEEGTLRHHTYIGQQILAFIKKNNLDIPFSVESFLDVSPKRVFINSVNFSQGYIFLAGGERLAADQQQIMLRFAKVFESTYRRFLDLQKAETQARESQIELGLERVRARTMAMQKSEELKEVIQVVYDQFVHLNINVEHTGFILDYKKRDDMFIWLADKHEVPSQITIPYFDSPHWNSFIEAKATGKNFFANLLSFEEKNKFYQDLFKLFRVPDEAKEYYFSCPGLAISTVLLDNVSLYIENFEGIPYTDEENITLMRLGKVFQQTYTRFLDLQKAEAQAKESQIQLALERVRARTMAMQKSDELSETVYVLFQQFEELGENPDQATIGVINEDEKLIEYWVTMYGKPINKVFKFSIDEPNVTNKIYKAWKENKKSLMIDLSGDALTEFMAYRAEKGGAAINPDEKRRVINVAFFTKGLLNVQSNEERSEESIKLLERFASVFEQTYTRFLDLQKVEAQARESQIQLALERVRARTMAMQRSDELQDAASVMVQQIQTLGVPQFGSGFNIWDDDRKAATAWMCNVITDNLPPPFKTSSSEDIFLDIHDAAQRGESLFVREQAGKELETHYKYMNSIPVFREYAERVSVEGFSIPDFQIMHCAFFSQGYLKFITYEPVPEAYDIFKRFAKVFEQTYTRFLDLQKAEAQAREAQIEAALEKVRSRSLAMYKSDDLRNVVSVVLEQLQSLGFVMEGGAAQIGIFHEDSNEFIQWSADPMLQTVNSYRIPYNDNPVFADFLRAKKEGKDFFFHVYSFQEKNTWFNWAFEHTDFKNLPNEFKKVLLESDSFAHWTAFEKNSVITVNNILNKFLSEDQINIIKRFAKVFEQTYTRFLDLQKAEAQAREAQIELGLERVRARAMAIHSSEELKEVVRTLFEELTHLDVNLQACLIATFDGATLDQRAWMIHLKTNEPYVLLIPHNEQLFYQEMLKAWKERNHSWTYMLENEAKIKWESFLFSDTDFRLLPQEVKEGMQKPGKVFFAASYYNYGAIQVSSPEPFSNQSIDILQRFSKVFDLSYTRFLDLQKAEAQAREAQIELGLERVRARAMAMQTSEELNALIGIVFTELTKLELVLTRCVIIIYDAETKGAQWWMANSEAPSAPMNFFVKYANLPFFNMNLKGWEERDLKWQYILEGENKIVTDNFLFNETELKTLPDFVIEGMKAPHKVYLNASFNNFGNLTLATLEPLSEKHFDILLRFAKVFDLTYTRFNDLQKAEAQAREATIEAALERVRRQTMAMFKSSDLLEVISVLSEQFLHLGFKIHSANFNTSYRQKDWNLWLYNPGTPMYPDQIHIPYLDTPFFNRTLESLANGDDFTAFVFSKEEKDEFLDHLYSTTIAKNASEERKRFSYDAPGFAWSTVYLKNTALTIANYDAEPYTEEQNGILRRFGNVFEQSYTRFLDLQKAEAQAREAQIEAALEKVRGNAMAMHNSNDLSSTASMVFTELRKLGINPIRCGVGLLNKESRKAQLYSATSSTAGDSLALVGWVMLSEHPVLEKIYDTWLKNEDYFPELSGAQLKSYYELLLKGLPVKVPDWEDAQKQYGHFLAFSVGCLYAWSEFPYNDSEIKILKRFATIIDLTFRRYIELQQSEANAKEAIRQAALDRIRADIASMRTISDLDRITPLIWNELTILGIPFIRCGVFIMDNEQQLIHTFLSTPEGKAIAAFHLPYNSPGHIGQVLNHWQQGKNYIDHWDEATFTEFADTLVKQGSLASSEQYMQTLPPDGFYLHFLPFLQGMLYVGNATKLGKEEIDLIQSVADAFSTAYARYEDFNKLEAAKKQVDHTLNELQVTQKQLIQSEKMASLGELTAGIAHEIQNPLNFVNNFSEVNKELLVEMKDEIKKGNMNEVDSIADDVISNEDKIIHHGKRADAIVKGMLQHSRISTGVKEPTDINALADEYLRLSYHGLRAKDKEFNAEMITDFDATIGKINIVPQDIGRVLLNLYNNAFYAVTEKKKSSEAGYEPTVSVSTKKSGNSVLITVSDNGNGIPQKIKEKIFQPFFTTKPTGQGTGLGLSLSYDIVKAHSGELNVESEEGKGSKFIIQLPVIFNA
ncbi:MAG TPA: ATP-binding protein [Hanamia sp.]|nr:ATP-binding protein [Hanamia sp.]